MFKGRIVSRSFVNGKAHTFQKDFDDYDAYQSFVQDHPEYDSTRILTSLFNPWAHWDSPLASLSSPQRMLPVETKHLPEGMDLEKYEQRRAEKRKNEADKLAKRQSLERSEAYLKDYLEENPEDRDAQQDLKSIQDSLKELTN